MQHSARARALLFLLRHLMLCGLFVALVWVAEWLALRLPLTEWLPLVLASKGIEAALALACAAALIHLLPSPAAAPRAALRQPWQQRWAYWGPMLALLCNLAALLQLPALPQLSLQMTGFALAIGLCIGIAEEVFFRLLTYRNAARWPPAFFLTLNACIFGGLHVWSGTWLFGAAALAAGASLDAARLCGAPLWLLILIHAAVDASALCAVFLTGSAPTEVSSLDLSAMPFLLLPAIFISVNPANWRLPQANILEP